MTTVNFQKRRVTVMGLGRNGGAVTAVRWLAGQGAVVTVTDQADERSLAPSRDALAELPTVNFHFGPHRERDFLGIDLLVVNPAVKPGHPLVELAQAAGAHVTSEIELFLSACPARVIGVTGTHGKSTTAALLASVLTRSFSTSRRRVWLGGNIGHSLLADVHRIRPDDWVVLELSSFQLHWLAKKTPRLALAVVTGFAPNHLDWHPTIEHYRQAKQTLLAAQRADDWAVLDVHDAGLRDWLPLVRGRIAEPVALDEIPPLAIGGEHNRRNAALAAAAALTAGCDWAEICPALAKFPGLPHRLQLVDTVGGRRFYNDSKATTASAVVAALATIREPAWLLAGGVFKSGDCDALAAHIARHARGGCFFGSAAEMLFESVTCQPSVDHRLNFAKRETLDEALTWCIAQSREGEAIALSPGGASFDQFAGYAQRGEAFVAGVRAFAQQVQMRSRAKPLQ